jgi:hypothetical protein
MQTWPRRLQMSEFILQFGSGDGAPTEDEPIVLNATTLDEAKMNAAMLYAGASFKPVPPTGFRILRNGETEVYRFPETP